MLETGGLSREVARGCGGHRGGFGVDSACQKISQTAGLHSQI